MSSEHLKSADPYNHRVYNDVQEVEPCKFCGTVDTVVHKPENSHPYSLHCPQRGQVSHRGHNGNSIDGKTLRGAVDAWNRCQRGETNAMCKPHVLREDTKRPSCICGLSLPCNDCLMDTSGFRRIASPCATSVGVRSRVDR